MRWFTLQLSAVHRSLSRRLTFQKVGPKVKLLGELMPGDARVALFGELESYQRFVVLADELDDGLSQVPLPHSR